MLKQHIYIAVNKINIVYKMRKLSLQVKYKITNSDSTIQSL
jgi:hypothetical protein